MRSLLLIAFMFQNATFFTVYPASAFEEKSHSVHLQWIIKDERLIVMCNVSEPFLPIVIYKNNIEDARCIPLPEPVCTNTISDRSASFIKLTNETIYTIRKFNPEKVNGNWSCSHGSGGKNPRDSEKVHVCNICTHVYANVLFTQCLILLIGLIYQYIKKRKESEGNNTNCGRVIMKTWLYSVYKDHCIKSRCCKQKGIRFTICGLLFGVYVAMVILLVELQCYTEYLSIINGVCIGVGPIINIAIYIILSAMKEDRSHYEKYDGDVSERADTSNNGNDRPI